jgi:hypothetical protein
LRKGSAEKDAGWLVAHDAKAGVMPGDFDEKDRHALPLSDAG